MSDQCKFCNKCKGGCKDVCACCQRCNTCGQFAGPVVTPPAPAYVPYPVYPSPFDPQPLPNIGPTWIGETMPIFVPGSSTVTIGMERVRYNNACAAPPPTEFLGTFTLNAREIGASSSTH